MVGPALSFPSSVDGGVRYLVAFISGEAPPGDLASFAEACLRGREFPSPAPEKFFDTKEVWVKTVGIRYPNASVHPHLLKYTGAELGVLVDEYEFSILLHWLGNWREGAHQGVTRPRPTTQQGFFAAAALCAGAEAEVHEAEQAAQSGAKRVKVAG